MIDEIQLGAAHRLWLLWLIPALISFYVYVFRTKTRLLEKFASATMLAKISSGVRRSRQYTKAAMIVLAVSLGILALAEPKYGFTWEEVKRRGVDIIIALDVSDSMLVEDVEQEGKLSRLERAKREITDLLRLLQGDRIGLVAFAGVAFVECPLTLDYRAAELFLDNIDTELIPIKGTSLGNALETSLEAFGGAGHNSQAIILITDGEDHEGNALKVAELAKERGVKIFPIGIGRAEGSPIPDASGHLRRDPQGELVLSRLDEPTLQKMALVTGGRYVRSITGDVDLEQIYVKGIKAGMDDQELGSKRRQRWEARFQWFLGICIGLLMLEPLVNERPREARRIYKPRWLRKPVEVFK